MAPRRKKKPVSNPARGFSTVSVPSKKHEAPADPELAATSSPSIAASSDASAATATADAKDIDTVKSTSAIAKAETADADQTKNQEKPALHELSPEELEEHLKDAELQNLIDQYGAKCANDAARQVARVDAEKRVLRGQAMSLSVTDWLTGDIIDDIVSLEKVELQRVLDQSLPGDEDESAISAMETDLTVKLWTLHGTLLGLGFREDAVRTVLPHVPRLAYHDSTTTSRDMVWGLEAALRWLALHRPADEMPSYRADPKLSQLQLDDDSEEDSSDQSEAQVPVQAPPPRTGSSTPITSPNVDVVSSVLQEFGNTTDPETLIPQFIALRCRLFEENPSLFDGSNKSGKKKKSGAGALNVAALPPVQQQLQQKINEIQADILFDGVAAEAQWQGKLADLRLQLAERRAFARSRQDEQTQQSTIESNSDGEPDVNGQACEGGASKGDQNVNADAEHDEDEEDDVLGRMFGLSSDVPFPDAPDGEEDDRADVAVTIRDLGKPVGMSPRRILEDSCRSRDSTSKVSYKSVRASSYSNRQAVTIKWSKPQEVPAQLPVTGISCTMTRRQVYVAMESVATPTATQAEWFVSTVALFLIFSAMPKERRAAMKLPAAYKDLFDELSQERKSQEDEKSKATLWQLQDVVRDHISSLDQDVVLTANFKRRNNGTLTPRSEPATSRADTLGESEQLAHLWTSVSSKPSFMAMALARQKLPIWSYRKQILSTLDANQVVVICSETGSGKSTQIPSFILEHELTAGRPCKIWVTEPRRISATSLARRVSEELGEGRNACGSSRSLVGYVIRLESKTSPSTRLIYATTGVVVRMLERPKDFHDITHLVLDEVHERTIDSDFLLIILRRLIRERPNLKLILMSATVDATRFSTYLGQAPILDIPGRTFPVEVKYLEDAVELTHHALRTDPLYAEGQDSEDEETGSNDQHDAASTNALATSLRGYSKQTQRAVLAFDEYQIDCELIVNLIMRIATDPSLEFYSKAILVFMPGLAEIRRLYDDLVSRQDFFGKGLWEIYALHSSIASDDQDKAFLVPPAGVRKIVIATNIAETGITIPDITAVIDTGKEKVMRFDERRQFSKLVESFISRANAKQRRGRAGRVQKGLCFHLFTKYRHDNLVRLTSVQLRSFVLLTLSQMAEQQTPEMLRLSLQDLVLRVKICKLGDVESTLLEALDPPSSRNIRRSIEALKDVKAITSSENLTSLGQQLAKLPLDVFLGKLIIYGAFFRCVDAALSIAAILSSKSPFVSVVGSQRDRDNAKLAMKRGDSDLLTVYNAYLFWKKARETPGGTEFSFCRKHHLSIQALLNIEDIKVQLTVALAETGLLDLTPVEQASLTRASYMTGRHKQFYQVPERYDQYSSDDIVVNSVTAWSFYPRLLVREGKTGWRSISNNQPVKLHITSVNRPAPSHQPQLNRLRHYDPRERYSSPSSPSTTELMPAFRFLSYYHMMQARSRAYQAHETSAVDDFAVSLLCGELDVRLCSGSLLLDGGTRAKFAVDSWRCAIAMKVLSARLRDALASWIRGSSAQSAVRRGSRRFEDDAKWLELWERIFGGMLHRRAGRLHLQT
ncbi:hypothetical protein KEM52_000437 [Ascosphaera acerosa]|nr:hypothetical protein KEM52_000437 [Ascosphaera acerosa]